MIIVLRLSHSITISRLGTHESCLAEPINLQLSNNPLRAKLKPIHRLDTNSK